MTKSPNKYIYHFPLGISGIEYHSNYIDLVYQTQLINHLKTLAWRRGDYYGRQISRMQRWYHEKGIKFNSNWPNFKRWDSHEYDPVLTTLQNKIKHIHPTINSVLINFYDSGNSVIPKHRDSEEIFGDNPTIIVLSLGASRTIRFSRVSPSTKTVKILKPEEFIDIQLETGSMLLMTGTTQKYFCHEILPDNTTDPRFSLTFRTHKLK